MTNQVYEPDTDLCSQFRFCGFQIPLTVPSLIRKVEGGL